MRPTHHTGVTGTDAWAPAHHLAKTVGIYGGTTSGARLHYAAGYRRPMVLALCSAERVSRRLCPLIESGAVVPPSFRPNPSRKGRFVIVLLAYIEPRRRPYRILHNQRGPPLATAVRARTAAIVATLPIRSRRLLRQLRKRQPQANSY
jgi:hypothetical protein